MFQDEAVDKRVNRLTLKQQRLITNAIKQTRILSWLTFLNMENLKAIDLENNWH